MKNIIVKTYVEKYKAYSSSFPKYKIKLSIVSIDKQITDIQFYKSNHQLYPLTNNSQEIFNLKTKQS